MKSLLGRIFVSFWIGMTLIGAAFALIYATGFPAWRVERRRNMVHDMVVLEARAALADDGASLQRLHDRTDMVVAVVGARHIESVPATPTMRSLGARALATQAEQLLVEDEIETVAIPLEGGMAAVAQVPRISPWQRALSPDTLPARLLVVFLGAGLLSLLLARYLTRPVRSLRRATQRFADGDLAVRVAPELRSADSEMAALGAEFDRMAGRVQELLESQQRLLQDVSHELRSPLARVRVAVELVRQRGGPEMQAPLDRIERDVERLSELIGQILMLTKLESGGGPSQNEIDLAALVEEVGRDADFEARSRDRSVVVHTEPAVLRGNDEVLRRAVENVVRNAVRFAPEGTAVEVALKNDGARIALEVRDHGPGVPEDSLERIFLPLYRVHPDRDRNTGGAGLGLAIAERAVKLHGGSARAHNARDGGLVVSIELPAERVLASPA